MGLIVVNTGATPAMVTATLSGAAGESVQQAVLPPKSQRDFARLFQSTRVRAVGRGHRLHVAVEPDGAHVTLDALFSYSPKRLPAADRGDFRWESATTDGEVSIRVFTRNESAATPARDDRSPVYDVAGNRHP
ncbi:MAG: hypothetical protein M5R36_27610 [Deltaproteobacteria bacterium]|nr:hypothetical protein [Deltaproteobacteria bacterium]